MSHINVQDLVRSIPKRHSRRQFTGVAIPSEVASRLMEPSKLRKLDTGSCRAEYVHAPGFLDNVFTGVIGSYGKIRGASALIALIVANDDIDQGRLAAGYLGEQYVLRAEHLGLGTCWVGGMFHFKTLMGRLSIGPDESVVSVIAVGWPKETKDTFGKLVHLVLRRKKLEEIADKTLLNGPPWLRDSLESVRMAPSAVNRQPWYFSGSESEVQLKVLNKGTLTPIDIGIAMLHFELPALAAGISGTWTHKEELHIFMKER